MCKFLSIQFLITVLLLFVLFKNMVSSKSCRRREDCSKQLPGAVCSLCIGETGATKCFFPFSNVYKINSKTLECDYLTSQACKEKQPCKNGGTCHDNRHEDVFICHCKPNYVGSTCEIKYNKIKFFYAYDMDFKVSNPMVTPSEVLISIDFPSDEILDEVSVLTEDGYYSILKLAAERDCNSVNCYRTYKGEVRYFYKPYFSWIYDFQYLGNIVLGYLSNVEINVIHRGTNIFNRKYKVFVSYPEKNLCVPALTQLSGCRADKDKPSLYYRRSQILIKPNIMIIYDGSSRSQVKEPDGGRCGSYSEAILSWKVWRLKTRPEYSDDLVLDQYLVKSITLNPFSEDLSFGQYRLELDVKTVIGDRSSTSFTACYFNIESLPLEAIIEGGTHRSVMKKNGLSISAVNSRDPNQPLQAQSITTKWSCTVLDPPNANVGRPNMCNPVILKSDQPYFIPADLLSEGTFNFTLEIWSDLYRDETCTKVENARSHQFAYQKVTVSNRANLLIMCQKNCETKVLKDNELILKVSYEDNSQIIAYRWTCKKDGSKENLIFDHSDNRTSYIFRIPGNTLESATPYTVTVSATVNGEHLSASYGFQTNDFSYSHKCLIEPHSGIIGFTPFKISCPVSESKALLFEYYDKTPEEAASNIRTSGRMLGASHEGELTEVLLTRGVLVVYITSCFSSVSKKYKVNLTENRTLSNTLLHDIIHSPHYFQNMPVSLLMQHISSLPDIAVNYKHKKQFLIILLTVLASNKIDTFMDVKQTICALYNILSKLGQGNMDFNSVQISRQLISVMSQTFKEVVGDKIMLTNRNEVKDIAGIILNTLELTLTVQNENEVDGTKRSIMLGTFLDLTRTSMKLEEILDNLRNVLSLIQDSGLPPTTIESKRGTFVFKVLEDDTKYNFSLSTMLYKYPEFPVAFSSVLVSRLKNSLKPTDNLALSLTVVNKNIFRWFNKHVVSNILIVSLNKRTEEDELINIREISSPMDMKMYLNGSIPQVKEVSQTIPLDPTWSQDILDLKVRVHRLDPLPGSKLSVTFFYPPTNTTLRVLMVEDYRPTYEMMINEASLVTQKSPYYIPSFDRTISNKLYYMGVLPGPGLPLNSSVKFFFSVNITTCVSWESVEWSSTGCCVGPNTRDHTVHCQCSHLSVFGAIFPFLPNKIDPFADAKLFLTVLDNPLVISVMSAIFLLYLILSVVCYKMDKKDRSRGAIAVLRDNFPCDRYPYLLAVYTSSRLFSGTSANVGVQLIGESSNSRTHILKSESYRVLNRNSDDWFLILCPKPLGIIQYLHLWHDNTGIHPDWYCDKVHVFDINNCLETLFIVDQWIEMSVKNYPEALIVPASSIDILKISRVISDNIAKSLREQRSVTGIFTQHPRSTVKRIYRVNIFTCSLLIALLCSIMFYTDPDDDQKPDDFEYKVISRDLYVSVVTASVIVAANYLIGLLFRKSYKCVLLKNKSFLVLRQNDFLEEFLDFDKRQSRIKGSIISKEEDKHVKKKSFKKQFAQVVQNIMKTEKLAPAVLPQGTPGVKVKKVWLILSWAVCVIIIIFCMYFITLYGLKMGLVKSKKWLTSISMSYVQDKFVISPLNTIMLAVMLAATFGFVGAKSNYRASEDEIRMSVSEIQYETYEYLAKQRQHPMYSPMNEECREKIMKKKQQNLFQIHMLRFVLSLCYIIVVFSIVQNIRSLYFSRNNHLERLIVSAHSYTDSFLDVYDTLDMSDFLVEALLKVFYATRWYNLWPLTHGHNHSRMHWISDYSWRMLGSPLIRQQRVYPMHCHSIARPVNVCIPHFGFLTEDLDTYSVGWSTYLNPQTFAVYGNAWSYVYPTHSILETSYRLQGESDTVYSNGGYASMLGLTIQNAVEKVTHLVDNNWMDEFTKVVFVEVSLYNVNLRVMSQVTLIVEFITTGVSVKAVRVMSVVDCNGFRLSHALFIILTLLFFLEICYQINKFGIVNLFRDMRNVLLVIIVIPSFLLIIAFFIHLYDCLYKDTWDRNYVKKYDYFDFDVFVSYHNAVVVTLSVFLLLSVWRSLLLLRYLNVFVVIRYLFKLSLSKIFALSFLVFICIIVLCETAFYLELAEKSSIMNLVTSQRRLIEFKKNLDFEPMFFSFLRYLFVLLISSFFIMTFVHFNPIAHQLGKRKKKNNPLKKI